jgi:hypothetical protein
MSETAEAPVRRRRATGPRAAPKATPAFFVLQVVNGNGVPEYFDKAHIRIVAVERSAEKVLELVEGGEHEHAFYLRGMVPAARVPVKRGAE